MTEILRPKDVCARLKISRSTLYSWVAQNRFPRQARYGVRAVGWRSDDVERWIESHVPADEARGAVESESGAHRPAA